MENATKALLIAAAVLIAISIITLGVFVFRKSSETLGSIDLTEYQIQQFNEKFTKYQGTYASGTEANALIQTAFNHNNSQADNTTCVKVSLYNGATETKVYVSQSNNITSLPEKLPIGKKYQIQCEIDSDTKLVKIIKIIETTTTTP